MDSNRLRSPVVWGSFVAQVLAILLLTGVIGQGASDVATKVAAGVLELLVLFGVLNDPTDRERF